MVQITFYNQDNILVKQWHNWPGVVPMIGDMVVLHFGDYNEEKESCKVIGRFIDGTEPDKIAIRIETDFVH
jgi:hypothetical protein